MFTAIPLQPENSAPLRPAASCECRTVLPGKWPPQRISVSPGRS